MRRPPSRPLRCGLEVVKVLIAAAIALLAVGPALVQAQPVTAAQADPAPSDVAAQARLDRLMERHDCSVDGLGPGVVPGSALVERGDRVRRVSFDDGWAVFTGDADGALVAVCRAALPLPLAGQGQGPAPRLDG